MDYGDVGIVFGVWFLLVVGFLIMISCLFMSDDEGCWWYVCVFEEMFGVGMCEFVCWVDCFDDDEVVCRFVVLVLMDGIIEFLKGYLVVEFNFWEKLCNLCRDEWFDCGVYCLGFGFECVFESFVMFL